MSKTIKIIDLLNKMANEEDVPEKIKYKGIIYLYKRINREGASFVDEDFGCLLPMVETFNDEVEIIQEEPEIDIQKLEDVDERYPGESPDVKYVLAVRINELIKAVKQLDNKINGK